MIRSNRVRVRRTATLAPSANGSEEAAAQEICSAWSCSFWTWQCGQSVAAPGVARAPTPRHASRVGARTSGRRRSRDVPTPATYEIGGAGASGRRPGEARRGRGGGIIIIIPRRGSRRVVGLGRRFGATVARRLSTLVAVGGLVDAVPPTRGDARAQRARAGNVGRARDAGGARSGGAGPGSVGVVHRPERRGRGDRRRGLDRRRRGHERGGVPARSRDASRVERGRVLVDAA